MSPERGGLGVEALREIASRARRHGRARLRRASPRARARGTTRARSAATATASASSCPSPTASATRSAPASRSSPRAGSTIPRIAEQALAAGDCDIVAMTRAHDRRPRPRQQVPRRHSASATASARTRAASTAWSAACRSPASTTRTSAARSGASPSRPPSRGDVLVVGGGPAGLKAAEIAARRGHRVTLVEREPELGGRLRAVRGLGDAAELFRSVEWLELELARPRRRRPRRGRGRRGGRSPAPTWSCSRPARGRRPTGSATVDGSIPVLSIDEAVARTTSPGRVLMVDLRGDLETRALRRARRLARRRGRRSRRRS